MLGDSGCCQGEAAQAHHRIAEGCERRIPRSRTVCFMPALIGKHLRMNRGDHNVLDNNGPVIEKSYRSSRNEPVEAENVGLLSSDHDYLI